MAEKRKGETPEPAVVPLDLNKEKRRLFELLERMRADRKKLEASKKGSDAAAVKAARYELAQTMREIIDGRNKLDRYFDDLSGQRSTAPAEWIESISEDMGEIGELIRSFEAEPEIAGLAEIAADLAKEGEDEAQKEYEAGIGKAEADAAAAQEALSRLEDLDDRKEKARLYDVLGDKEKELGAAMRAKIDGLTSWQKDAAFKFGFSGAHFGSRFFKEDAERLRKAAEQASQAKSWFHGKELKELPSLLMGIRDTLLEKFRELGIDEASDAYYKYDEQKLAKKALLARERANAETDLAVVRGKKKKSAK